MPARPAARTRSCRPTDCGQTSRVAPCMGTGATGRSLGGRSIPTASRVRNRSHRHRRWQPRARRPHGAQQRLRPAGVAAPAAQRVGRPAAGRAIPLPQHQSVDAGVGRVQQSGQPHRPDRLRPRHDLDIDQRGVELVVGGDVAVHRRHGRARRAPHGRGSAGRGPSPRQCGPAARPIARAPPRAAMVPRRSSRTACPAHGRASRPPRGRRPAAPRRSPRRLSGWASAQPRLAGCGSGSEFGARARGGAWSVGRP